MADNRELALVLKLVADQFQSELKKSSGLLGDFQKFIGDWKTQVTLAGTALFAVAKSTANFGEEALKTSQRLGLTVERTTALQYAADLANVPVKTLERGLQTLAQRAVEASRGSGEGAQVFTALGLSAVNAAGQVKPLDQLFFEMQDRLKGLTNQAQFVDAGVTAFGKSFQELTPLIKQGSAATKEAMEEGKRFGVTLSQDQAQAASRFNDELKKLDAQLNGVKLSIGNALIPTLRELIELFRTFGVGSGLGAGLTFMQQHLIRLNVLLKELQANSQFLFGTGKDSLTLGQLGERIKEIEAGGQKRLFELQHPGVLTPEGSGSSGGDPGGIVATAPAVRAALTDQEKLGRAKLSIFLSQNEALAIQMRLQQTLAQDFHVTQQQRTAEEIIKRTQLEVKIRDEADRDEAARQERRGRMIVEQTQLEVAIRDRELAAQQKASQGFFDGWVNGLKQYVQATDSAFGLAADMARRTAQAMEQNFRQFFFDLFQGRIQTLQDMLQSLSQFVAQIASQIAAQFATRAVIGALGLGGEKGFGFATGGAFTVGGFGGTDSQPVFFRATPGERVSVQTPGQQQAQAPIMVVVNNYGQNEVSASSGRGANGQQLITVTVRDVMRKMIAGGEMDKAMRARFNLTPGEA